MFDCVLNIRKDFLLQINLIVYLMEMLAKNAKKYLVITLIS